MDSVCSLVLLCVHWRLVEKGFDLACGTNRTLLSGLTEKSYSFCGQVYVKAMPQELQKKHRRETFSQMWADKILCFRRQSKRKLSVLSPNLNLAALSPVPRPCLHRSPAVFSSLVTQCQFLLASLCWDVWKGFGIVCRVYSEQNCSAVKDTLLCTTEVSVQNSIFVCAQTQPYWFSLGDFTSKDFLRA